MFKLLKLPMNLSFLMGITFFGGKSRTLLSKN